MRQGYQLNWATNGSEELATANAYPTVRLFNVGEFNRSAIPFDDLQRVALPWSVASNKTASAFSAVCWFVGRRLSDALTKAAGHAVPIGLIESAWGATSIQEWMPMEALQACNHTVQTNGELFNAMIHPFAVGPLALASFQWYQGE